MDMSLSKMVHQSLRKKQKIIQKKTITIIRIITITIVIAITIAITIVITIAILLMITAVIPRKIRRKKKIQPQQTVEVVQIPS